MTITRLFAALFAVCMMCAPAAAQNTDTYFYTPGGGGVNGALGMCLTAGKKAVPCSDPAALPQPVSGTFSATLSGFTPGGVFATLTATASSASVALPAGATVFFQNSGTTTVSCTLGIGSATATANEILIPAGSGVPLTVGSNTFGACIDQTGSASNLVVLAGGSGLGTPFGGGAAGGGGGGAITAASGSYAAGALSAGAFAAGAGVDGWDLTQGSKTDAVAAVPTSATSASVIALLKALTNVANSATPACVAAPCVTTIGNVGEMANVGGVDTKSIKCGSSIVYDASTSGSTQLVAISASTSIYVCGYTILASGTVNVELDYGTGSACATGTVKMTPAYQLTAQAGVADGTNEFRGLKTIAAQALCLKTSAAVAAQAIVYYTQF